MKFKIPRNVKSGMSFAGLEIWGWVYFLPTFIVLGGLDFIIISFLPVKIIGLSLIFAFSFFAFMNDESTGAMNIAIFTDFWKWYRSSKQIEPVWDKRFDREYTVFLKTSVDKADLRQDRFVLSQEGGEDFEDESED